MNEFQMIETENECLRRRLQENKSRAKGAIYMLKISLATKAKKKELEAAIENSITLLKDI